MDGWNVSFLLGPGLFSGANSLLVSGSVFETDVRNFLFNKHQIVADWSSLSHLLLLVASTPPKFNVDAKHFGKGIFKYGVILGIYVRFDLKTVAAKTGKNSTWRA